MATLHPGTNTSAPTATRASEVAIDSRPRARDLYVVLTRLSEDGQANLTVFVNPLVMWLWIAGVIVALGGLLAALAGSAVVAPRARRGARAARRRGAGASARASRVCWPAS